SCRLDKDETGSRFFGGSPQTQSKIARVSFRPRRADRVCESQYRRLEMARYLSLVAWFTLATVCPLLRRVLYRSLSSFLRALYSPARQYRGHRRWLLVL